MVFPGIAGVIGWSGKMVFFVGPNEIFDVEKRVFLGNANKLIPMP